MPQDPIDEKPTFVDGDGLAAPSVNEPMLTQIYVTIKRH